MNEWDKWIAKYYMDLFRHAKSLILEFYLSCEPEDILGNAYLKVRRKENFKNFKNDEKRMHYFRKTMRNLARDLYRKSKRTPLPLKGSIAGDENIVEQSEKEERVKRIAEKLKRIGKGMPRAQREIFEIIIEGKTEREIIEAVLEIFEGGRKGIPSELYTEIRERLGISESNLYKRMERIKKIIKKEFEEDTELTDFL